MLKSMTGYGRGCARLANLQLEVEGRSVNHRYCNINLKLPRQLTALENETRRYISQQIGRGRIDVFVSLQHTAEAKTLQLDLSLAKQYYQALQRLKQELSLDGEVSLELLARNPSLFEVVEIEEDEGKIRPLLEQALKECLDNLDIMRVREGQALAQDISERCQFLEQGIKKLEPQLARLPQAIQERLEARLKENASQIKVDKERLLQEVVIYAARCDTTEEEVRFKSHLQQFQEWLKGDESPVGKKLDFLIQEMNRELSTLTSKVNDGQIIQAVIGLKSELEKIREQVQNIE